MANSNNKIIQFKPRKKNNSKLLYIIAVGILCLLGLFFYRNYIINVLYNNKIISFELFVVLIIIIPLLKERKEKEHILQLANGEIEVSPEEILRMKRHRTVKDYEGVYVIYNASKHKYYVGQSIHVMSRIAQHFNGHGNGDVYVDYRNGDSFTIKVIKLEGSGFKSLNSLEKRAISAYNAYYRGYNKTRGNRG